MVRWPKPRLRPKYRKKSKRPLEKIRQLMQGGERLRLRMTAGALLGGVLGFVVALVLPGTLLGDGQVVMAVGVLELAIGAPVGVLMGAVVSWLIARRGEERYIIGNGRRINAEPAVAADRAGIWLSKLKGLSSRPCC
jgi:hypothetical protein